jgi:hypothetical protein
MSDAFKVHVDWIATQAGLDESRLAETLLNFVAEKCDEKQRGEFIEYLKKRCEHEDR